MSEIRIERCDCGCGQEAEDPKGWLEVSALQVRRFDTGEQLMDMHALRFAGPGCLVRAVHRDLLSHLTSGSAELPGHTGNLSHVELLRAAGLVAEDPG